MEDLTFHLEGIPAVRGASIDFEGPLTLILQLLNKNRIEIKDVSISQILDQYMTWMAEMRAMDLEVTTEFVAMASHLVYIKARSLLHEEETLGEMEELVSSLELLKAREQWEELKGIAGELADLYRSGSGQIPKDRSPLPDVPFRNEPEEISSLVQALLEIMHAENLRERTPEQKVAVPVRIAYSIDAASAGILRQLRKHGRILASELFGSADGRSQRVAMFLAVLELAFGGKLSIVEYEDGVALLECTPRKTEEQNESA